MPRKPAFVVSIAAGDYRARFLQKRDKLVSENFHLVRPIAERIMLRLPPSFELADLIQTGHLGLLHAATSYRPREHDDTPFSAYARIRIRGTILDSVRRRHYTEATRPGLEMFTDSPEVEPGRSWSGLSLFREQRDGTPSVEIFIDRSRLVKRVAISRQYLSDEQAAVIAAYYSPAMPSLATVAAQLAIPEWRAVRAHTDALAILRQVLKAA